MNLRNILCIPHTNCRNDNYDIINYTADNTLCYLNDLERQKHTSLKNNIFILVVYDRKRLEALKNI